MMGLAVLVMIGVVFVVVLVGSTLAISAMVDWARRETYKAQNARKDLA